MMKCTYCGRENVDTAKACSECGSEVVDPSVQVDAKAGKDENLSSVANAIAIMLGILFGTAFLSAICHFPFAYLVFPGVAFWAANDAAQWRKRARACLGPDEMLPDLATSNATKPFAAFVFSLFFCWGFPCYLVARHRVKKFVEERESKPRVSAPIGKKTKQESDIQALLDGNTMLRQDWTQPPRVSHIPFMQSRESFFLLVNIEMKPEANAREKLVAGCLLMAQSIIRSGLLVDEKAVEISAFVAVPEQKNLKQIYHLKRIYRFSVLDTAFAQAMQVTAEELLSREYKGMKCQWPLPRRSIT
jgi:hypothetical protein